jgi:tetratricopeptide (TPR) repeat protein
MPTDYHFTRSSLKIHLALLVTFCLMNTLGASGQQGSFYSKAKYHFYHATGTTSSLDQNSEKIDSLLKSVDSLDLEKTTEVAMRIAYFLLEKGMHGKVLDIFIDLRAQLENNSQKSNQLQKSYSKVLNITGAIYEETGVWNEALAMYVKSLKACEEIDYQEGMARVYLNIGNLYFNRNDLFMAEKYYRLSIAINLRMDNKEELFINYNNLAGIYNKRKDDKKALEFTLMAMNLLDLKKDFYNLSLINMNLGCIFDDMKNYPNALSYYRQAVDIQQRNSFGVQQVKTYLSIINVFQQMKLPDSANVYISKALTLAEHINNQPLMLNVMKIASEHFRRAGEYKRAAEYYSRYLQINDSIERLNSLNKIDQLQSVYEVTAKEKDLNILRQKVKLQELSIQRQRAVIAAAAILVVMLTILIIGRFRSRKRDRMANELIRQKEELIRRQDEQALVEKEKLVQLELDFKNRQLASYALVETQNNELLLQTIAGLKEVLLGMNQRDKTKSDKLREIIKELQQYTRGNSWDEFRLHFEAVHPSFEEKLMAAFPDLSPNDIKICAFIKLNLSSKEIAAITFREPRSIESARNRLRMKLGLTKEMSIHAFLSKF